MIYHLQIDGSLMILRCKLGKALLKNIYIPEGLKTDFNSKGEICFNSELAKQIKINGEEAAEIDGVLISEFKDWKNDGSSENVDQNIKRCRLNEI